VKDPPVQVPPSPPAAIAALAAAAASASAATAASRAPKSAQSAGAKGLPLLGYEASRPTGSGSVDPEAVQKSWAAPNLVMSAAFRCVRRRLG